MTVSLKVSVCTKYEDPCCTIRRFFVCLILDDICRLAAFTNGSSPSTAVLLVPFVAEIPSSALRPPSSSPLPARVLYSRTQEELAHGDESSGLLGGEDSGYGSLTYLSQMPLMPQGYSRSDNYVHG